MHPQSKAMAANYSKSVKNTQSVAESGYPNTSFLLSNMSQDFQKKKSTHYEEQPQAQLVYYIEVRSAIREWTLTYRYSEMKQFYDSLSKRYSTKNELPRFPSKKIWKTAEKVVNERRAQLADFLNQLIVRIDILDDDYICEFLNIQNTLRDFLLDLEKQKEDEGQKIRRRRRMTNINPKASLGIIMLKKSMLKGGYADHSGDDSDFEEHMEQVYDKHGSDDQSGYNYQIAGCESLRRSTHRKRSQDMTNSGGENDAVDTEITLYQMFKTRNLTDEQAILRFFGSVKKKPNNKDNFVRDLDEYYFKVRPKLTPKLIRLLLEGDVTLNIPGLLSLMSEIDSSFMSSCSIVQLLSKLLDYQKNIYADHFIREFAKIDPQQIKSYSFEKFLKKENSLGYKQSILHILQTYVEKRRTLKTSTSSNNASFNLSSKKDHKTNSKVLTDEEIVKKILFDKKVQKELVDFIKLKQMCSSSIRGGTVAVKLSKTQSGMIKKSNTNFIVPKKKKSNELIPQFVFQMNAENSLSSQRRSSQELMNDDSIKTGRVSSMSRRSQFIDFQEGFSNLLEFKEVMTFKDIQNLLSSDSGKDLTVQLSQIGYETELMPIYNSQIEEFLLRNVILNRKNLPAQIKLMKVIEFFKELIEVVYETNKVYFIVSLIYFKQQDEFKAMYVWQESDSQGEFRSDQYLAICLRQDLEQKEHSSLKQTEVKERIKVYIRAKNGFFKNHNIFGSVESQQHNYHSAISKALLSPLGGGGDKSNFDDQKQNTQKGGEFTLKLNFGNNAEIGTRSTTGITKTNQNLINYGQVTPAVFDAQHSDEEEIDLPNQNVSNQQQLPNKGEQSNNLEDSQTKESSSLVHQKEQIEKCKLKLLESIVEILVPIQSKLNDANKKRMNVEFDFIN